MRTGLWFRIKPGYQLSLSVVGENINNPQFVGGARYVPDMGADQMWDVTPGPYVFTFPDDDNNATVRVGIRFISSIKKKAIVSATITKPNGNTLKESSGVEHVYL